MALSKKRNKSDDDSESRYHISRESISYTVELYEKLKSWDEIYRKFGAEGMREYSPGSDRKERVVYKYESSEAQDKYYDRFIKGTPYAYGNGDMKLWEIPRSFFDVLQREVDPVLFARAQARKSELQFEQKLENIPGL